ncbi:MAG: transposase [candidate division KSB1 bacterium]|nr:transposase [candidate division KSB1 bacterium]
MQHVLPHRFIKVRYYGFLSSSHRKRLEKVKELLNVKTVATEPTDAAGTEAPEECEARVMRCPKCGGAMKLVGEITPKRTRSPCLP